MSEAMRGEPRRRRLTLDLYSSLPLPGGVKMSKDGGNTRGFSMQPFLQDCYCPRLNNVSYDCVITTVSVNVLATTIIPTTREFLEMLEIAISETDNTVFPRVWCESMI